MKNTKNYIVSPLFHARFRALRKSLENTETVMNIFLIVLVIAVVLIICYILSAYNSLVKQRNSVEEAFATMDVYLKKRWDLIPNIVATVKGYAKHEAETLEKVIAMRSGGYRYLSDEDKISANAALTKGLSQISVVAEQYPDLKANQNFMNLSNELSRIEADIANARKFYNAVVKKYNNKVMMFPSCVIARMFKFEKKSLFAVEDSEQRQNVKVEF